MSVQTGPNTTPRGAGRGRGGRAPAVLALALAAWLWGGGVWGQTRQYRIRVAWGGGPARQWVGSISLSSGRMRPPVPLGMDADASGSIWLEHGRVTVTQRSPRAYDAVDLNLSAPPDAQLSISLMAKDGDPSDARPWEVSLARLAEQMVEVKLDDAGNRLLVQRAPGDRFRLEFPQGKPSLIYSPGERFLATLRPFGLPAAAAGSRVRFAQRLLSVDSGEQVWSGNSERKVNADGDAAALPIEFPVPDDEGVYDLLIEASPIEFRARLGWQRVVARRRVQLVVLAAARGAAPLRGETERDWKVVSEIDPANPSWWKRLTDIPIPYIRRQPLNSGDESALDHPLGRFTQLADSPGGRIAWSAYTLPIETPGRPHVLEVEYPGGLRQGLGVSVVEPNAAGHVVPIGIDSGVCHVDDADKEAKPKLRKHRLIFWPRTSAPLVLLTNRRPGSPAVFGKIRVLAGPKRLPRAFAPDSMPPGRLLWGYFHKPLFSENFSATQRLDAASGRTLDSWETFHQGATRLADYLHHVGHSGAMVGVLSDGGAIFPSEVLRPNPRHDTGVFFADGADPLRKDALELLFRVFDREGLQLVPALDFSTPLPELEDLLRRGGPASVGVRWTGPLGRPLVGVQPPNNGRAPYYNVLNPRVQAAMLRVVRELARRYASHPSFAGLAVQLSASGYAQLPSPEWGMDDTTIAAFERDNKILAPGTGDGRFQQRAHYLTGQRRELWITWRNAKLGEFYRLLRREVAAARGGANLYLAGAESLDSPDVRRRLSPALPPHYHVRQLLRQRGLDPGLLSGGGLVLLRPSWTAPVGAFGQRANPLHLDLVEEIDRHFQPAAVSACLFHYPAQFTPLPEFDKSGAFEHCLTRMLSHAVPSSAREYRRRFVHAVAALDAQMIVDGGWLLPMGQEDALREFADVFRRLPPGRFQTVAPGRTHPLAVRSLTWGQRTYVYLANDSPWPATAQLRLEVPPGCQLQGLGARHAEDTLQRDGDGTFWEIKLAPYELAAAWLSTPQAGVVDVRVTLPDSVRGELEERINGLVSRVAVLKESQPLDCLSNGGFETPPDGKAKLSGWVQTRDPRVNLAWAKKQPFEGKGYVRLASTGAIATVASEAFSSPSTGRLALSVRLRAPRTESQPPLRLAIEARREGAPYYRFATVGQGGGAPKLTAVWNEYIFQVQDLPPPPAQVRVRFDLMGAGEVSIDDVRLYNLHFSQRERVELSKLIQLTIVQLQSGQYSDCHRMLAGYWPRFLRRHAPKPAAAPRRPPPAPTEPSPPTEEDWWDRFKSVVPEWMRP